MRFKCSFNTKAHENNVRVMAICPGPTFDGLDIKEKNAIEHEIQELITSGEETPNPNRVIIIQKYVSDHIFTLVYYTTSRYHKKA